MPVGEVLLTVFCASLPSVPFLRPAFRFCYAELGLENFFPHRNVSTQWRFGFSSLLPHVVY